MARMNINLYLVKRRGRDNTIWMIKDTAKGFCGIIDVSKIYFPKDMIGKRIRLKVEVLE